MKSLKSLIRLEFNYDILCPNSWIFYQILKKKSSEWESDLRNSIDYAPIIYPLICQSTYSVKPASMLLLKKKYFQNELHEICDVHGIGELDFEMKSEHLERRSYSILLLLNNMRRNKLPFYENFLQSVWREFWNKNRPVNSTAHFHRIGRELGISFRTMEDIIFRTEERDNYLDLSNRTIELSEIDRITGSPWLRVFSTENNKRLFAFSEITRLELLDELIKGHLNLDQFSQIINEETMEGYRRSYYHKLCHKYL